MGNTNGKESLIGSLNALSETRLGSVSQTFGPRSTGWVGPAAYKFTNETDTTGYSSYKGTDYVMCEGRSCSADAECCDKFTCQMGRCVL